MTVYIPWNTGLGDQIATHQLLWRLALAKNEPVQLSRFQNGQSLGRMHDEIRRILPIGTSVQSVNAPGDTPLDGFDLWANPFFPVSDPWYWRGNHQYVVYHFDGVSSPEKNPPIDDQARILQAIEQQCGLPCIPLVGYYSLVQAAGLLCSAAFFVGCDSGFSHLAHCTRTPIFLLQYGLPVVTCHRGKEYVLCEGAGDFIDWKLPTWIRYRKFLGLAP